MHFQAICYRHNGWPFYLSLSAVKDFILNIEFKNFKKESELHLLDKSKLRNYICCNDSCHNHNPHDVTKFVMVALFSSKVSGGTGGKLHPIVFNTLAKDMDHLS